MIDTTAAKANLLALGNPMLTHEEALKIAQLPGNHGIIRKQNEFRIPVTEEVFADALVAAAQGRTVTDSREISLYFELLKPKIDRLLKLVGEMDADPQAFHGRSINESPSSRHRFPTYVCRVTSSPAGMEEGTHLAKPVSI